MARAMPMIMRPKAPFRATTTGPRRCARRAFTSLPRAVSRRRSPRGSPIGRGCARNDGENESPHDAAMMRRFGRFACIDWSGAKGERQQGIAVAVADGVGRTPRLIERVWSREAVLGWLLDQARRGTDLLVGI